MLNGDNIPTKKDVSLKIQKTTDPENVYKHFLHSPDN